MTTNPARRLWLSNAGHIACDQHIGYYAMVDLAARRDEVDTDPDAVIITPLDLWEQADAEDRSEWVRLIGRPMECESCEAAA